MASNKNCQQTFLNFLINYEIITKLFYYEETSKM